MESILATFLKGTARLWTKQSVKAPGNHSNPARPDSLGDFLWSRIITPMETQLSTHLKTLKPKEAFQNPEPCRYHQEYFTNQHVDDTLPSINLIKVEQGNLDRKLENEYQAMLESVKENSLPEDLWKNMEVRENNGTFSLSISSNNPVKVELLTDARKVRVKLRK